MRNEGVVLSLTAVRLSSRSATRMFSERIPKEVDGSSSGVVLQDGIRHDPSGRTRRVNRCGRSGARRGRTSYTRPTLDPHDGFPAGFFDRADPSPDPDFYTWPRLVTHIDDGAIAAVGELYDELQLDGAVIDLMSSWVSHFRVPPRRLTVLGMNAAELERNPHATERVLHDLNEQPRLPFPDASFDAAVCCVSVDYLVRPIEVFRDVARIVCLGGPF
ncbi:MAG: hypothetical protein QOD72_1742, partial [Acidimicrobiaceae bacterium]|nr:hypothetical protein [Acidimicrobiaceae bacterium]